MTSDTTRRSGLSRRGLLGGMAVAAGATLLSCDRTAAARSQATGTPARRKPKPTLGTPRWTDALPASKAATHTGSPGQLTAADGTFYAGHRGRLRAIAADDGSKRWESAYGPDTTVPIDQSLSPVLGVGRVYTLRVSGGHGTVYATNATTGHLDWRYAPGAAISAPVFGGGALVVVKGSTLQRLDTATGRPLWSSPAGTRYLPGPAAADGRVYAVDARGGVDAVDAQSGTRLWHNAPPRFGTTPAATRLTVTDSLVLVAGNGRLRALGATSGRQRWMLGMPGLSDVAGPVTAVGDTVYVVGTDESTAGPKIYTTQLVALSATNGRPSWDAVVSVHDGHRANATPAVGAGLVAVTDETGTLRTYDVHSGAERWKKTIHAKGGTTPAALTRPAITGGTVAVLARDQLWAFSA